jgi:hypothetical protein
MDVPLLSERGIASCTLEGVAKLRTRADVALMTASHATGSASPGYMIAAGVPIVASDVPSVAALRDAGAGAAAVGEQLRRAGADVSAADAGGFAPAGALR